MRASIAFGLLIAAIAVTGCKKAAGERRGGASSAASVSEPAPVLRLSFPGTREGAAAVVRELARPNGYVLGVFRALRPAPEDYAQVFTPDVAAAVKGELDPIFDMGNVAMKIAPELSELHLEGVTVEELRTGAGRALSCPAAYKKASRHMKPGVVVYCFKLVRPGETEGQVHDGLVYVNEHWAIFPKPFSAIRGALKDAGVEEED